MVKYVFSILLSFVFLVTGLPVEAARNDNYPTPLYCYVLSNGRVTTYVRNSTANVSGYIDGGADQVQLNNIYPSDNWVYGGYPTSRGRKWAWFRVSDVIYDYNYQMKKTKALRTAPAYRKKERGQTIGSVYVNDVIYVVSEYGDLAQIIYPINGGYKLGWVEKSVVDWGSRPAPQPAEYYPTGNIVNVANGTYKISSAANSNIGLDLDGAIDENGANLHLWYRADTPQQKFVIENCGDGYYSLRPSYTDKKIDVMGGNPNNGTNVRLWTSNGTDAQKWRFIDAGNGYVYIESKLKPGLSLDCQGARVDAGVNVQLWLRGNVAWHKWKLERIDTQPGQSAEKYVVSTNGATLALRSGPGTQYGIRAKMPRGSVVEVYSISNGWANLSYNGTRGYASAQYLQKKSDAIVYDNMEQQVKNRINQLYYTAGYKVNSKFIGDGECHGFANKVYQTLFSVGSVGPLTDDNFGNVEYSYSHIVGSAKNFSSNDTGTVRNLFYKAKPGAFIQMGRRKTLNSNKTAAAPHSAILVYTDSNGAMFYEANADGKNTIKNNYYTWAQLAERNRGFTLYLPDTYQLR